AERVVVEIQFQARAYHYDGPQTQAVMGFDPAVELPGRTAETDAAVDALGPEQALVDRGRLRSVRAGVADGTLDATTVASSYEELIGRLQQPIDASFAGLERDAGHLSGGADVQEALDAIRALMAVTEAESDLVVGIEHLFLQSPDAHRWTYLVVEGRTSSQ